MAFDTWGGEVIALGVISLLVLALLVLAPLWWWRWRPEARRARRRRESLEWLEGNLRAAGGRRESRDESPETRAE